MLLWLLLYRWLITKRVHTSPINYIIPPMLKRVQSKSTPFVMTELNNDINTNCNLCKSNLAKIFQVNGDYCLHCWQEITYPSI